MEKKTILRSIWDSRLWGDPTDHATLIIGMVAIGKSLFFLLIGNPSAPPYAQSTVAVYGLLLLMTCAVIRNQMILKGKLADFKEALNEMGDTT